MTLGPAQVTALRSVLRTAELRYAVPPWLAYPGTPFGCFFRPTGGGEGHLFHWGKWLMEKLPADHCSLYQRAFPAPRSWRVSGVDYYSHMADGTGNESTATAEQIIAEKVGIRLWTPDGRPSVCSREMLIKECTHASSQREFVFFWGHHGGMRAGKPTAAVFSQWWMQSQEAANPAKQFSEGADDFICAEQYMMAGKAAVFNDVPTREAIMRATEPAQVKKLGREVMRFDSIVWSTVAFSIVAQGSYLKFTHDNVLKEFLLGTGDAVLVEASPHDNVWGIGYSVRDAARNKVDLRNASQWKGDNLLGFALMEARAEIRRVHAYEYLFAELQR